MFLQLLSVVLVEPVLSPAVGPVKDPSLYSAASVSTSLLLNGVCFQKHKETVCPAFPVSCPNHCSFSSLPRSEVLLLLIAARQQLSSSSSRAFG